MPNEIWKPVGPADATDHWVGHDPSQRFPVYTRGNAGEVYPEVFTPLSFSVAAEAAERAMRNALLTSGLIRRSELETIPLTTAVGSGVFGGYAYLNLSIQRLASARAPGGKATDADVNYLGVGDPPPHVPGPGERNRRATLAGTRYVWRLLGTRDLPELTRDQRRVDAFLAGLPPVATASDVELRESVRDIIPLFADLFERHLVVSFGAGISVSVLSSLCDRQLGQPLLATQLLAGLGDVDSAAPSQSLWDLSRAVNAAPGVAALFDAGPTGLWARLRAAGDTPGDPPGDTPGDGAGGAGGNPAATAFLTSFRTFLATYGSRGPNEWDTAFDTWETDPDLALTLIDRMRAADDSHEPARQHQRLAAEAAALEADCLARLRQPTRGLFRRALAAARLYSRSRERSKTTVVRAIHGARLRTMELDQRLARQAGGHKGDLWFLLEDDLDAYLADPASFAPLIAQRRAQHRRLAERIPPFFFSGSQPPLEQWARRDEVLSALPVGQPLTGLPGCPGRATGRARVVTHPGDPRGLAPGDVLVAPLTDPSWTPLFLAAEAVVVDVGAIMSHAVIVSRELGIPCVVSATDATRRIPDGALIEVDGNAGTVTVLAEPDPG